MSASCGLGVQWAGMRVERCQCSSKSVFFFSVFLFWVACRFVKFTENMGWEMEMNQVGKQIGNEMKQVRKKDGIMYEQGGDVNLDCNWVGRMLWLLTFVPAILLELSLVCS